MRVKVLLLAVAATAALSLVAPGPSIAANNTHDTRTTNNFDPWYGPIPVTPCYVVTPSGYHRNCYGH
jgi:hypothetical protein